jgi:tRNA(Ile)-lysidine synthase
VGVPPRDFGGPGFGVLEKSLAAIDRHRMLEGGETVVVAVSGGPDSTCLLDVLWRLGSRLSLTLHIAHVDHGLSVASSETAARVSAQGARDGFEVHLLKAPELEGPNLHARARDFRYGFFQLVAEQTGARKIATGHTLDDRAETTLARLIHGAGTEGLAGMPPAEGNRIRPLVGLRRVETRAYCEEIGLAFDDDPGNLDERFERAAVRARVLSAIEGHWGDGAVRAVARAADRLHEDATALNSLAGRLYESVAEVADDGLHIDLESMLAMPRALRRRVLERAVGRVRDRSGGIAAALDGLDSYTAGALGRYAVARGIEIAIRGDHVLVTHSEEGGEDSIE